MTIKRSTISRRRAIAGAASVGVGLPVLAACGDDGADTASRASDPSTSTSARQTPPATSATERGGGSTATTAPAEGIATSDVPVGGGLIADDVVVTQPSAGEFRAFSAVCTHQGCLVSEVSDGTINCACHGSRFSIEDGSVTAGPAPSPLPEAEITVQGDRVVVG